MKELTRDQAEKAMANVVEGGASAKEIGEFLLALKARGETVDEIHGFLDCLEKRSIPVHAQRPDVMDVCGTGGDASGTFNISTAVAFVVAAAGQPVAKHGNRSVSSRSGSFDVLESLGIPFETDPVRVAKSIDTRGLGLLFAPAFHPSLKALAPIRKGLKVHTVFNALAVLLNPARVKRQLVGVYHADLLEKIARVLLERGSVSALVVHGQDGLDEISLSAPTDAAWLKNGGIERITLAPEDFGLRRAPREALAGGDARENARLLLSVLDGERGPRRDIVVMNAAAALVAGGHAADWRVGVEKASAAIDSGKATLLLKEMRSA